MFQNNRLPLLRLLKHFIYLNPGIYLNHIILTKVKVKDKEHPKLRCLVQVGLVILLHLHNIIFQGEILLFVLMIVILYS